MRFMLPRFRDVTIVAAELIWLSAGGCKSYQPGSNLASQGVLITSLNDRLRVEINGELFTEYFFKDVVQQYRLLTK